MSIAEKIFEHKLNNIEPRAVNPILPLDELIPDVEARVFTDSNGEERVFLYGSHDSFGSKT
ncbi:MAG: hypothetical protein ACI4V4_02405 [Eubacterium sp.]